MKLNDSITKSVAASVSDVLEGKVKKEDDFKPHMMYDPKTGKGYKAEKPEDHERMKKMGYVHEKPKMESPEEPRAQGEKEFKAKHAVKKSGEKEDGTVVKEMTISIDEANVGYWFNSMPEANKFYQKADKIVDANPPTIVKLGNSKVYTVELNGEKKDLLKVAKLAVDSIKEETILEKLKAGKGKTKVDIDHTGEGIPAASSKYKLKFKKTKNGFDVSGEKKDILAYLQSKEYDMDSEDIEDLFPELLEAVKKEGNAFTKALMAAKKNGDDEFVVAGKKYKVEDYDDDGEEKKKEVEEARSKFSKSLLKKASDIALSMGGNMTGAVKKIEKLKKGLSDDPEIKAALQLANEEYVSEAESKKEKYQKVFQAALKKFGVKSPGELEGAKKKEFFDYVDKNYDAGENETD